MRKIEPDQCIARACHHDEFHHLGPFNEAPGTVQSPGVCADAQCCKITWLEELASESNTIQAQEDITQPGKTAGQYPRKLYMGFGLFIVHSSGLMCSFGLASFVVQEQCSLHVTVSAGQSRKSI